MPFCPSQETAVCPPIQAGLGCTQLLWEIRQEALQTPQGNRHSDGGNNKRLFFFPCLCIAGEKCSQPHLWPAALHRWRQKFRRIYFLPLNIYVKANSEVSVCQEQLQISKSSLPACAGHPAVPRSQTHSLAQFSLCSKLPVTQNNLTRLHSKINFGIFFLCISKCSLLLSLLWIGVIVKYCVGMSCPQSL